MTIQIFNRKGEVAYTVPVGDNSTYNWKLQSEEYISVAFSASSVLQVKKGFYTDIDGLGRFEIVTLPEPTASSKADGYDYELRMDRPWAKFKNRIVYLQRGGVLGMESRWSLTDTIESHCSVLTDNLTKCGFNYKGDFYHVVIHDGVDTEKSKLIDYDATSLHDALGKIAEAFECEWWIVEDAIHFGKCETGDSEITLEMHKEIASLSRSEDSDQHGTRLYAFGSSRNLNQNYRRKLKNPFTVNGWKAMYDSKAIIKTDKPKTWYSANGVLEFKAGVYEGQRFPFTVIQGTYTEDVWTNPTFEVELPAISDNPGIAAGDKVQFIIGDVTASQTGDSTAAVTVVSRATFSCFSFQDLKLPRKAVNSRTTLTLSDGTGEKNITFIGVVTSEDGKTTLNDGRDFYRFTDGSSPKTAIEQKATLAHASMMYVNKLYTEPIDGQAEVKVQSYSDNVLQLPVGTPYIDSPGIDDDDEIVEVREQNEDIYPRALLTIDSITTVDAKETDEDTGEVSYWKAYRFTAKKQDGTPFHFDNSYLINEEDKPLSIHFESGKLSGLEFEVHFNPDASTGEKRVFEITRNSNYKIPLPNETAYPQVGDTLYMFNMDADILDDELVTVAEQELKTWAEKEMMKICRDSGTYTATINPVEWGRKKLGMLQYGQKVKLNAPHLVHTSDGTRSSRIIAWELKLHDITQGEYTIGESSAYSSSQQLSNEVQELVYWNGQIKDPQTGNVSIRLYDKLITKLQSRADNLEKQLQTKLSKSHDDTASGLVGFLKGLESEGDVKSRDFLSASDSGTPAGWALRLLQGIATGELDDLFVRRNAKVRDLTVTGAAHFFKLIIDEIKSAGGSVLLTPANGFIAERVTHHGTVGGEDERYILYWRDSDGEKTIDNQWMVGDFAVCMTANLKQGVSHNAGNKTWWCKVVESGNSGGYNFITLDWYGRAQGRTITEGGETFTEATSSGVPEAGDNVAMLGSVATDKDGHFDYKRQSAIYLAAYDSLDMGLETPFLAFYYGIDDFCLSRHRKTHLSRLATNIVADKFTVHSDKEEYPISVFFGDWKSEIVYPKAGVVNYKGCTWTSRKDGNQGNEPSSASTWWVSNKGEAGKSADAYDITFRLNGVAVTTLNYDTIRATDGEVAIEAVFSNNGSEFTADEATLGCYDERGVLMGLAVTGRDSGGIVVDGGELYLSPDCSSIQCSFSKGGRTLCSRSLTVIRNGSDGVTIAKTEYKYSISDSPDAAIDWDGLIAFDKPPVPEVAPGKYLHVMTIVTYSDGTVTSTVTISYCGTDGDSVRVESTSVTYCVTKDGRQPDDSRFTSTDVPAVAVGDYLWCKTVVTYSDGKSTKSYAVSRVGSDGDQGYSLHFAYADSVTYSGTTPTVTNFSTTRKGSSEWLGVSRSQDVADPTDPKAYQWTKIKGEAGKDGQNGRDGKDGKAGEAAVHYELRDNGSRADISILSKKITLRLSLSYDFYKVEGSRATKTAAEEVVSSIGGKLAGSGGTYTLTGESTFDSIDDLPASAIVTAKVGGAVVATAVCKVSMSKRAYFDVDSALGSITERVSTAEGEIGEIRNTGKAISAKVNSLSTVAAPNLLLNSGFSLTTDGIPNYWEVWDDNKAKPAVTISGDNCKVEVKAAGSYQGIKQTRKMLLHSPLKLTFSCIAKGSGTMAVMLHKIQGTTQTGGKKDFALKADAQQLSCTFELSQYIDSWRVMIGFASPSVGDNVTFYNPKLEIGDVATPWCENGNDRVLATGMDIENGLVEFTANKFNIRDNYGNQMFAVETGGTGGSASRVKLRNLAMGGLAIRDMVTMETWGDVRKYFTFDTKELTSSLRFETCLNTFRLSKKDGKSCLLGREEGETADSIKMFNVLLPCQDYFEPATDEYLAYMEEAMRYVGNRIVILNESGYRIAVYGRQEVTHMTTYTVWDSDASTPAKLAPVSSTQPRDLRPVKDWDGSAQGYYIPTDKIHDQKRDYTMQKVWTSDEYWVVPDGSMAIMECVCDICAPYDTQGATVSILEQPPMGQSVFWNVSIGKILRKGGAA